MDEGFRRGLRRPRRRSYGIAGSGGTQRCDLLQLEVENAATTTPKQPGIVPEALDLAQCFPSSQGAPFLPRGRS
jgi:hypothetical protein